LAEKKSPTYYSTSDDIWLNALSKLPTHAEVKQLTTSLGKSSELGDWGEFQGALNS
jgi:hypothetical protein